MFNLYPIQNPYVKDNLLFFYLLLIIILKDMPYCQENPDGFLLFILNLVAIFGKY
jgi:hypothetical protein